MSQFRHIRPGEKLPGLPTQPWNLLIDGLNKDGNLPGADGKATSSVEIDIRNDTAATIDLFGVIGLGGPLVTHANDPGTFLNCDQLLGIDPAADQPIAIVRSALTVGDVGRARVLGVTPCQVNLTDTDHRFAGPTTSTTELTSGATGIAKILWTDTDFGSTGTQWAVVLLSNVEPTGTSSVGDPFSQSYSENLYTSNTTVNVDFSSLAVGVYWFWAFMYADEVNTSGSNQNSDPFQVTPSMNSGAGTFYGGVPSISNSVYSDTNPFGSFFSTPSAVIANNNTISRICNLNMMVKVTSTGTVRFGITPSLSGASNHTLRLFAGEIYGIKMK